jgi:acetyl-CoA acetyltransferase
MDLVPGRSLKPELFSRRKIEPVQELTVDEILKSRMICDPITLLQCCPNSDGAAAAVLCSVEVAKKYSRQPIKVAASVLKMGDFEYRWKDLASSDLSDQCAKEAYEMAGCGPEDVDVCELHDAFTISDLQTYGDIGLRPYGQEQDYIESGAVKQGNATNHLQVIAKGNQFAFNVNGETMKTF